MNGPKITVVLATFNAERTVDACLRSIFAQTYRNFEVLVADGLSGDSTLAILDGHPKIAYRISERDRGIYDAWNKVVPHATGDWLYFIGADDELFDADVFAKAAAVLSVATENVVYGKVAVVLPNGDTLSIEGEPWLRIEKKFREEMTIPHQGTFHRRKLFSEYGLFDPGFKVCGDYEFLLRELKDRPAKFISDLVVAKMGFGGTSGTFENVPAIISELSRARKMNGFRPGSPRIYFRWIRYYARMAIAKILGKKASEIVADLYRVGTGRPRLWTRDRGK